MGQNKAAGCFDCIVGLRTPRISPACSAVVGWLVGLVGWFGLVCFGLVWFGWAWLGLVGLVCLVGWSVGWLLLLVVAVVAVVCFLFVV